MNATNARAATVTPSNAPVVPAEVRARYECVAGLEVHAQLATETKAFCGCSTRFGDPPNSNVCPVCLGLPGALPVLNRRALEFATKAALVLHCEVQRRSRFARKNYFYPDLPKGYQISQYELPLATGGWLEIKLGSGKKRIGITRLHMEEDAAKNLHEGFADSGEYSHIDFNRCGVPLIEIVSEPDLRSPEEAYAYLTNLKQALEYTEVSDCNMEAGSLRCDANVSVRRAGSKTLGTKVEVKNLNSFRYLTHALEYEIERQISVIESGGAIVQETRLWNVSADRTEAMRSKEFAHDYRYFPEPDLLPVTITEEREREIFESMPELPDARRARFVSVYGISEYDASVLTATRILAEYAEQAMKSSSTPKLIANWIQTELLRRLKESGLDHREMKHLDEFKLSPRELSSLVEKVAAGQFTAAMGKKILAEMIQTGKSADEIVAAEGVGQTFDRDEIERICREILARNPENLAKYRAGNENVFNFFVGQVMKETKGTAKPQAVNETLTRLLQEKQR